MAVDVRLRPGHERMATKGSGYLRIGGEMKKVARAIS
ncbi:MAG: hypothetical protein ACI8UD_000506 [Planctomycetota bacterium]|jgi:hypothetical protein